MIGLGDQFAVPFHEFQMGSLSVNSWSPRRSCKPHGLEGSKGKEARGVGEGVWTDSHLCVCYTSECHYRVPQRST